MALPVQLQALGLEGALVGGSKGGWMKGPHLPGGDSPGDGQHWGEGTLHGKTVSWDDALKISREAAFS